MIDIKYILLVLFTVSFNLLAATGNWEMTSDFDGVKSWQLSTNFEVTGNYKIQKLSSDQNWSKTNKIDYLKNFELSKKEMLKLINITNWKSTNLKWTKHKSYQHLYLTGSYTDPSLKSISFIEEHFIYKNLIIQLLHTHPSSLENGDDFGLQILNLMKLDAGIRGE